jgi:hypothetical protein
MKKIIVLSQKDELKDYFLSLENNYICEVITCNYDESHVFEKLIYDDESLLLLSIENYQSFKSFLETNRMKINGTIVICGDQKALAKEDISILCEVDRFIKGVINTSLPLPLHLPWFNLLVNPRFPSIDHDELESMGENLEKIVNTTVRELGRLKEIHEKLVPIREEQFKGLKITSKFGAGESAGGEFFDVISNENEVLLLVARSRSYLVSSMIMGQFDDLRSSSQYTESEINRFIDNLQNEIDGSSIKAEKRKLDFLFVRVDLKTMSAQVWKSGDSTLLNDGKLINKESFKMDRGSKVAILSSGLLENSPGKEAIISIANEKRGETSRDLLNEVFYTLRNDKKGMFFSNDATMLVFEVDKNAILQI